MKIKNENQQLELTIKCSPRLRFPDAPKSDEGGRRVTRHSPLVTPERWFTYMRQLVARAPDSPVLHSVSHEGGPAL